MEETGKEDENLAKIAKIKYLNDKVKTSTFVSNINRVAPPMPEGDNENASIVVKSIQGDALLAKVKLELDGYAEDPISGEWILISEPIMNPLGIQRLIQMLRDSTLYLEFSNLHEDFVHRFAFDIIKKIKSNIIIYRERYALDYADIEPVCNKINAYVIGAVNKAKNAGHRNVIRNSLSEESLRRVMTEKEKESFLSGLPKIGGRK